MAFITNISSPSSGPKARNWMCGLLILSGILIALVTAQFGILAGLAAGVGPLVLLLLFSLIANPYWGLLIIFFVNYFILGIHRYVPNISAGIMMDGTIIIILIGLIIQSCYKKVEWGNAATGLTLAASIWLLFCTLQIFNLSGSSMTAWATSIRGVAGYFFILAVIVPVIMNRTRHLKTFLFLWAIFTILAAGKAYIQKTYGFDTRELIWLYEEGGYTTHLIHTGIRYFSFFSDAANFGASMGFSMVVFTMCAIAADKKWEIAFFAIVAFLGFYGMMISGTRGALAVPFTGFTLYVLLSRNWRVFIPMAIIIAGTFSFLKYTNYLEGNQYVRRMRSAFNPEDASLQVRLMNQEKMKIWLKDHPFGAGIGMGGGKAKDFAPNAYMSQIPTDSWFVMVWAETGIVGLLLYIALQVFLIIKCSYIVMFKIEDKKLRMLLGGLLAGIFGVFISAIGNEVLAQFPNGIIIYTSMAFIFMGPRLDAQLAKERELTAGNGK